MVITQVTSGRIGIEVRWIELTILISCFRRRVNWSHKTVHLLLINSEGLMETSLILVTLSIYMSIEHWPQKTISVYDHLILTCNNSAERESQVGRPGSTCSCNYYSHRDAGCPQLFRKGEVQRGLSLDPPDTCGEEAAPLQAAIFPPPSPLLGSGLRPGTVRSWSQAPIGRCLLWRHNHDENWWSDTLISLSEETVRSRKKSCWICLPPHWPDLGSSDPSCDRTTPRGKNPAWAGVKGEGGWARRGANALPSGGAYRFRGLKRLPTNRCGFWGVNCLYYPSQGWRQHKLKKQLRIGIQWALPESIGPCSERGRRLGYTSGFRVGGSGTSASEERKRAGRGVNPTTSRFHWTADLSQPYSNALSAALAH